MIKYELKELREDGNDDLDTVIALKKEIKDSQNKKGRSSEVEVGYICRRRTAYSIGYG